MKVATQNSLSANTHNTAPVAPNPAKSLEPAKQAKVESAKECNLTKLLASCCDCV